ncbi:hypothetical protein DFH08DRAFT_887304 [Mycena albidolilacea]|uniref:Zn(2)-C6 fungal-type domain-containing protein n=1 Tax=Mycena albidolilacea TaxID=1033008 RepID=A0AAD6ZIZ1_9AGAR|nr:hypothetical protein DFH08DRAFT_887304 [Mycena albidolilacea]
MHMSVCAQQPSRVFVPRRRRTDVACQNCRRRKVKCIPSGDPLQDPCERCTKKGLDCQHVGVGTEDDNTSERSPSPLASHSPVPRLPGNYTLQVEPRSKPPLAHLNPSAPSTVTAPGLPSYPARSPPDDRYFQQPGYNVQNLGSPVTVDTSASSNLNTNSYPSQIAYVQATTPNDNFGYNCRPPPTNDFPCTCPCYCGGTRR